MIEASIITFCLILCRVSAFWFTLPIFGQVKPPQSVKVGLAVALTVFWFNASTDISAGVIAAMEGESVTVKLGILAFREMLVGGMLGLAFNLFIVPARIAGSYLAQELGLSLAALSDPTSPESSTVVSTLFQMIGLLLFFILNLHHLVIYSLHSTFELLPVASEFSLESSTVLIEGFSKVTGEGISIIGPAAIALLIMLIAILLLAKAVPAFNLFSVGISIRLIAGILIVLAFLPDILNRCAHTFESAQSFIETFLYSLVNV